jgi:hypothetical protein
MIHAAAPRPAIVIATKTKTNAVDSGMFRLNAAARRAAVSPAPEAAPESARPHSTQNFALAIKGVPHCGQNLIKKDLYEVFPQAQLGAAARFQPWWNVLYSSRRIPIS